MITIIYLYIMAALQPFSISTASLEVTSPAFGQQGFIPSVYSCEGKNIHPALSVKNIPAGTQSLALILEDPGATKGVFDHWVVWNIDPAKTIGEGSSPGTEGKNSGGSAGYTGPCPPAGTGIHHYHFTVYALDTNLSLDNGSGKAQLIDAMKGHILAQGELIGLYQHQKGN